MPTAVMPRVAMACPVPAPVILSSPLYPRRSPAAPEDSARYPEFWQHAIRHAPDAQIAALLADASVVRAAPPGAVRQAHAALAWRAAQGCAPVPHDASL